MTDEWEPADRTRLLAKRRRALVLTGLQQFLVPVGILIMRALDGRSLLAFGLVMVAAFGVAFMVVIRPLWAPKARARWEEKVLADAVIERALISGERVGPDLYGRVRERAQKLDSDATAEATIGLLGVLILVGVTWSDWNLPSPWQFLALAAAGGVAILFVVLPVRRARPARRWLADPPPPFVPDGAGLRE